VGNAAYRLHRHGERVSGHAIHPSHDRHQLPPAVNHQPEFAAHCVTPDADKALEDGALAMAWTCIDLAANQGARENLMGRTSQG
jgi:hypothetical protein